MAIARCRWREGQQIPDVSYRSRWFKNRFRTKNILRTCNTHKQLYLEYLQCLQYLQYLQYIHADWSVGRTVWESSTDMDKIGVGSPPKRHEDRGRRTGCCGLCAFKTPCLSSARATPGPTSHVKARPLWPIRQLAAADSLNHTPNISSLGELREVDQVDLKWSEQQVKCVEQRHTQHLGPHHRQLKPTL